jgi:hypothetical protein
MENKPIPVELDWVTVRAKCNLLEMLKALHDGASQDVEAAEECLPERSEVSFSISQLNNKRFSVSRCDDPMTMIATSVDFVREQDRITVSHTTNEGATLLFEASITLNNRGECRLKVGNEELELWQIRRKALETLFFGGTR